MPQYITYTLDQLTRACGFNISYHVDNFVPRSRTQMPFCVSFFFFFLFFRRTGTGLLVYIRRACLRLEKIPRAITLKVRTFYIRADHILAAWIPGYLAWAIAVVSVAFFFAFGVIECSGDHRFHTWYVVKREYEGFRISAELYSNFLAVLL